MYQTIAAIYGKGLHRDQSNAIFLLKNSLNSLDHAIHNLTNPVSKISEQARMHLRFNQRIAVENSFSLRTVYLRRLLADLKHELSQPDLRILNNLNLIRLKLETVRNEYLRSEMVFGYYIDLLHTRAISGVERILKGYDVLATETLRVFLSPLGYEIPTVIVYLEQIGDGAAIMRADVSLWDRYRNPCAVIKMPQSNICTPRSSIFHEAGHQIGSITGLNKEGAELLFNTVRSSGGSVALANYWKFCATEIIADQIATQLTNWIGALTMFNIYSGSSGSTIGIAGRMFFVIPRDPHLMGYLRILSNLESCKQAFGVGPWIDFEESFKILYPTYLASPNSLKIIEESQALLPSICRALSLTKLKSLGGKSLEEMFPMKKSSPNMIKKLLNLDLSNFSIDMVTRIRYPFQTLVAFGIMQMMGGKSTYWVTSEMGKWLNFLGEQEMN
jgi:hypothetical protein